MQFKEFSQQFEAELRNDIIPFWQTKMTDPAGGFYGRMDGLGKLDTEAERGAILNARILWTFSAAHRVLGDSSYLDSARHSYEYIRNHFVDKEFGGTFWSLNADGSPKDTKKQYYAIAFMIYGLSEYFRTCGDSCALDLAIRLYGSIREHSLDPVCGGYVEAATRHWQPIADMRLSDKDRNDAKTMNTHLHILEGYTSLYRVWKDATLARDLEELIRIFLDRIVQPDGHLGLFFGMDWELHSDVISYGHDIEASWLLCEAAEVLGKPALTEEVRTVCRKIADASMEGYIENQGMIYEYDPATDTKDGDRHWWVQAECVVGCFNQYQLYGEKRYLRAAADVWNFIGTRLLAPEEWYWSVRADGSVNTDDDRAGFWKCPYHNSRMCLEIIERIKNII
ncbi:MAG: AGE family epimerase/isomerase [Candidatus Cryptobacteroides sp.]